MKLKIEPCQCIPCMYRLTEWRNAFEQFWTNVALDIALSIIRDSLPALRFTARLMDELGIDTCDIAELFVRRAMK